MKIINKSRGFICGVLVGALTMAAVPVLADNELVSAMIDNSITLIIANESKPLPADYVILNYKGYTYLPSRYVAEELGANVSWDAGSRTINISEPPAREVEKIVEVEVPVEKIVYVDRDESYQRLPVSQSREGSVMQINTLSRRGGIGSGFRDNTITITADINNKDGQDEILFDYSECSLTVDGTSYLTKNVPSDAWDQTLMYSAVAPGKSTTGFFIFPAADVGTKNYIMTVPARIGNTKTAFQFRFTATTYND